MKTTNEEFTALAAVADAYKKGIKFGTGVTREILDRLGSPDKKLKIIHIAGTNGKGSVAEYITQILICAGNRVGTFTSPAAYEYNEQFKVDGKPLPFSKLESIFKTVLEKAEGIDATGFELETCAAFYAFEKLGCEYAVIECGMGGRDDATNAAIKKEVAVITSISLEHTSYLGNTLGAISSIKAGIIKNCPVVVSALQDKEVLDFFSQKSAIFAGQSIKMLEKSLFGQIFIYDGKIYKIQMAGFPQPYNAACAIEVAKLLKIDENAIYSGVNRAKAVGRIEVFKRGENTYILDGGHNPAGVRPLAEILKEEFNGQGVTLIFGCLSDKDIDGNLKILSECAEKIIAVVPNSPRAAEPKNIIEACKKYFKNATLADSLESALEEVNGTTAVCGSFTLMKEAKNWIDKKL